jgi:hypothetical protein
MASTALISQRRVEYIKLLTDQHAAQRREDARREVARSIGRLQAELEKSLPADVTVSPRQKRARKDSIGRSSARTRRRSRIGNAANGGLRAIPSHGCRRR